MRYWIVPLLGLILVAGCARPKACLIIPMQLELARTDRDHVKQEVTTKQSEIQRLSESVDITRKRVDQLKQERDDLQRVLEQQAADSAAAAGGKKR